MWKKRFAPSVDCTISVARRDKGAFRPLSTHCPRPAIWKWADARWIHSPPFSMGGHGNIFTSAGPFARVYIQNIRPYLQRLARHPSYMQRRRATMACTGLQMSTPTLSQKCKILDKQTTSQIFLNRSQYQRHSGLPSGGRPQQFCVSWFLPAPAGAALSTTSLKTVLQLPHSSHRRAATTHIRRQVPS